MNTIELVLLAVAVGIVSGGTVALRHRTCATAQSAHEGWEGTHAAALSTITIQMRLLRAARAEALTERISAPALEGGAS